MTVITKPTWNVDGWTGNTVDANGIDWFCESEGWFGPVGVRVFDIDRPTGHGTYSSDSLKTPRVITLTGLCTAPSHEDIFAAMDKFNALLADGKLHELVVEEPTRTLTAMVKLGSNPQLQPRNPRQFDWQLVLVAPDPRKSSSTEHEVPTSMGVPPGGGVMWDGPSGSTGLVWNNSAGGSGVIWQTDSGIPGIITVTNSGTADAPLSFIFSGATSLPNPGLRNVQTGQRIVYNGTITTGNVLTISSSTEGGSVSLDGTNMGPALSQADWFSIPKGSSIDIEFTSSGYDPAASMAVRWRDTYI